MASAGRRCGAPLRIGKREMAEQAPVLAAGSVPDDREQAGSHPGAVERDEVSGACLLDERRDLAQVAYREMRWNVHVPRLESRRPAPLRRAAPVRQPAPLPAAAIGCWPGG